MTVSARGEVWPPAASSHREVARPVAGDGLLHPVAVLAIAVLLVNDHFLKAAWPGLLTGKLSDVAGLLFFPLLLQAVWELGSRLIGRPRIADRHVLLGAIAVTGAAFAAIQLVPAAADAYSAFLGGLQWLVGLVPAALAGNGFAPPHRVMLTPDPSDLVALPVLLATYRLGVNRGYGRQHTAFAVLMIAGLASLATSPPPYYTVSTTGETLIGSGTGSIDVLVRTHVGNADDDYSRLVVRLRGDPADDDLRGPVAVRYAFISGDGGSEFKSSVTGVPLDLAACDEFGPCSLSYRIELHPVQDAAPPVVVRWTLEATADYSIRDLELVIDRETPVVWQFTALGLAIGLVLGSLVVVISRRIRNDSIARLSAEIAAGAGLIAAATFVAVGNPAPGAVGISAAAALMVLGAGVLIVAVGRARWTRGYAPGLLLLGLAGLPMTMATLVSPGVYRPAHVMAAFAAIGFCVAVGLVSILREERVRRFVEEARRDSLAAGVVILAVLLIVLMVSWTLIVTAGVNDYPFWYAPIPVAMFLLLGLTLWRWLDDNAGALRVTGLLLTLLSLPAFLAASSSGPLVSLDPPAFVFESLGLIFAGGLLLAFLGRSPWRADVPPREPPGALTEETWTFPRA